MVKDGSNLTYKTITTCGTSIYYNVVIPSTVYLRYKRMHLYIAVNGNVIQAIKLFFKAFIND